MRKSPNTFKKCSDSVSGNNGQLFNIVKKLCRRDQYVVLLNSVSADGQWPGHDKQPIFHSENDPIHTGYNNGSSKR